MMTLLGASLEILLLLPFVGGQDLLWVLGSVRRGIGIRDADIDDAVSSTGLQPMNQYITLVFASVFMEVASDCAIWVIQSTQVDFGFVTKTAEGMRALEAKVDLTK
jgi:hypothetical protein